MKVVWGVLAAACIIISLLFASIPVLKQVVLTQARSELAKGCPACELKIGSLELSWWPAGIRVSGLDFKDDPASGTAVDVSADGIDVRFDPLSALRYWSLGKGAPTIRAIDVDRARVTVTEAQGGPPGQHADYSVPGVALKGLPEARVDGVRVRRSHLTYRLKTPNGPARIEVRDIQAETNGFATRAELLTDEYRHNLVVTATGQLEKSGRAVLKIDFDPFADKNSDRITIEVHGQRMPELDKFFGREDGITITGTLWHGIAEMTLAQGHLSGTLMAMYQDLRLHFHPNGERNKLESSISNAIAALTTAQTRPRAADERPPRSPISTQRLPREPVTKLLIRGLLAAAQRIMTTS